VLCAVCRVLCGAWCVARGHLALCRVQSARDHIPDTTVVYYCLPTEANVVRICKDIEDQLYDRYQVRAVPCGTMQCHAMLCMPCMSCHVVVCCAMPRQSEAHHEVTFGIRCNASLCDAQHDGFCQFDSDEASEFS
jgi:hypothetical protein